jgi:hypothetical protein
LGLIKTGTRYRALIDAITFTYKSYQHHELRLLWLGWVGSFKQRGVSTNYKRRDDNDDDDDDDDDESRVGSSYE